MEKLRVGVIGIGQRGIDHVIASLCPRQDIIITYLCDLYEDRARWGVHETEYYAGNSPKWTLNYREVIESPEVDVVIVASSWDNHIPAAVYAMECGKPVGIEAGGAYSVDDCWKLVNTYEKTGIHCMMLENCCYDRRELMVMNMVREGLFGKVVHCEGGYQHDLRDEICEGEKRRHYRLRNYKNRNCDTYPTHAIGPLAKTLDINRGNRMVKLTSMASGAWGLNEYAKNHDDIPAELQSYRFCQGDIVRTSIKCAHGETISLILDTTLPHYYSRNYTVRGTKGYMEEARRVIYYDGMTPDEDGKVRPRDYKTFYEECDHSIWKYFQENGVKGGHGGIDWLIFDAFFTALRDNDLPPIDTYDTAAWMAITPLSEMSIVNGSMPVDFPDFTRGMWTHRTDKNTGFYSLDK